MNFPHLATRVSLKIQTMNVGGASTSEESSINMDETDSLSHSWEELHANHDASRQPPLVCLKGYILSLFDNFSMGPFFATATFFIVCLYVNSVAQVFTENRVADHPKEQPILDLGFDWFVDMNGQREYADLFVVGACVASFVRFMPTYIRWAFLRRFLFFYGTGPFCVAHQVLTFQDSSCF